MAINEAEILRQLNQEGIGQDPSKFYSNIITDFGNELIKNFRKQIESDTKSNNGALKSSVVVIPSRNGFEIEADFYYKFIDDGVSGVGSSGGSFKSIRPVVTSGLYKFKNLGVPQKMAQSLREWSGSSIQQAYAIGVNIKRYGIKPKNITDKVITDQVLERMSEDLSTVTGLMIEVSFDKAFDIR